jgi:hypothetical protein
MTKRISKKRKFNHNKRKRKYQRGGALPSLPYGLQHSTLDTQLDDATIHQLELDCIKMAEGQADQDSFKKFGWRNSETEVFNRCINDKIQSTEWDKGFRFENKGMTKAQIDARDRKNEAFAIEWKNRVTPGDLIRKEIWAKSDAFKDSNKGWKGFLKGMAMGANATTKIITPFLPPQIAIPLKLGNLAMGSLADVGTGNASNVPKRAARLAISEAIPVVGSLIANKVLPGGRIGKKRVKRRKKKSTRGGGSINSIINSLPFELHAPGYNFLGPGTKYKDRISGKFGSSKQHPINTLDAAALSHDAAYSKYNDVQHRTKADKVLREKAKEIYSNCNKPIGERSTAYVTDKVFQLKNLLGA